MKCQSVKLSEKKRCQKQYTLILPWRWLCLWYNTKIILHTRDPRSPFSWNGSNWYLALECAHWALSLLISCCKSWLQPWHFIGSTKKFLNKAKLMVLRCWGKEIYLFWPFYLHRDKNKTLEKYANIKSQILYVDKLKVTVFPLPRKDRTAMNLMSTQYLQQSILFSWIKMQYRTYNVIARNILLKR